MVATLLGTSALPSHPLAAASDESEVPVPLLRRLLDVKLSRTVRDREAIDLVRDRPPENLEALVPDDLDFVAALVWEDGVVGLYDATGPLDELSDRFELVLSAGPLQPRPAGRGGFRRQFDFPLVFCEEHRLVTVRLSEGTEDVHHVEVHSTDVRKGCRPSGIKPISPTPPLPILLAPKGVQISGGGGHGNQDGYHTSATLETNRSPYELANFFGAQLAEQRWDGGGLLDLGDLVFQPFTHQDEDGVAWLGLLTVYVGEAGEDRRAVFRMQRVSLR